MAKQYLDPDTGWLLPVHGGRVTQGYGPERTDPSVRHLYRKGYHTGIDIAGVPEGADVVSPCDGTVSVAGEFGGYGQTVVVLRGQGISVLFGHLSRVDTEVGKTIDAGDVLGGVGTTGVSTGVHLHYEYRRNDDDIDPVPFMTAAAPAVGLRARVRENLNLRAAPDKNSTVLSVIPAGTPVLVSEGGWVPVFVDGRQGWMWSEFLDSA